jgi:N-acetylglutamate synthase-like GNAT family acetyltransferase
MGVRSLITANSNLYVERFQKDRQNDVLALISQVWAEFDVHDNPAGEQDLTDIPNAYSGGASGFWLALSNGDVVGTASLKDLGAGLVALKRFYVAKAYRGAVAGTAKMLFDALVQHARQHGARAICLGTIEITAAAKRFYEKNGFERVDRETLPVSKFASPIDTLFFRLSLTER